MMYVEPRATMATSFLVLVMRATGCREHALESVDTKCTSQALAFCALVLSEAEGRGDPESACVYVCEHSQDAR